MTHRRSFFFVPLTVAALALAACGSDIESDEPLGDQLDTDQRDEFIDGFVAGTSGTVARSEAECISDAVFDAGLSLDEIMVAQLGDGSPTAATMAGALGDCIDPDLDLDVPLTGAVREQLAEGVESAGLTADQVDCLFDAYIAEGFDARDLFVAGVAPNPEFDAATQRAVAACP